ncbi:MAG: helix-turn-helix transcriptional regulator [Chryseobacterium jejuense]|uniref:helix-turn-helix transcriptional regulator n=1 Tax=Chryseobacterium jejuense TaxID=445960 RepID=UPI003D0BA3BC
MNKNEALIKSGDNKSLIMLNKKYLQIAKKKKYKDGEAICYIYIASTDIQAGNYDDARNMFNKAKYLLSESHNTIVKTLYFHYNGRYKDLIKLAKKNDSSFFMKCKEAYPELINNLLTRCPDLETSELIFCAMLKLNFTSKEIATYLFILPKSAQQRKSRIRKRLNISGEEDIYDFINSLG